MVTAIAWWLSLLNLVAVVLVGSFWSWGEQVLMSAALTIWIGLCYLAERSNERS
jgi:uncharacterized membrane protein YphA (DoxX/SURF4 family)